MKATALLLPALVLGTLSTAAARADILGSSVTGSLTANGGTTNLYDPANNNINGGVPAGYGNSTVGPTVVIGSGIEFGFEDSGNLDTADFTATGLVFTDTSFINATAPLNLSFSDPSFTGFTLASTDIPGIVELFSGDTLQIFVPQTFFSGPNSSAHTIVFTYGSPAPTPEPGSLALLGTGTLGGLAAFRRRRLA